MAQDSGPWKRTSGDFKSNNALLRLRMRAVEEERKDGPMWLSDERGMLQQWERAMESPSSVSVFIKEMERFWEEKEMLSPWLAQALEGLREHSYLEDREVAMTLGGFIAVICERDAGDGLLNAGLCRIFFDLVKGMIFKHDDWTVLERMCMAMNNLYVREPEFVTTVGVDLDRSERRELAERCRTGLIHIPEIFGGIVEDEDADVEELAWQASACDTGEMWRESVRSPESLCALEEMEETRKNEGIDWAAVAGMLQSTADSMDVADSHNCLEHECAERSVGRFLAAIACGESGLELVQEGLWDACWDLTVKLVLVHQDAQTTRFLVNAMANIYMRRPDLMDSLALSDRAVAVVDVMKEVFGIQDRFSDGAVILTVTAISRERPEVLNRLLVEDIMKFISSGLAHPSVRRLAFWALSESVEKCPDELCYEDVRSDLLELIQVMTIWSCEPVAPPELIKELDAFLAGVMSRDPSIFQGGIDEIQNRRRSELMRIMKAVGMVPDPDQMDRENGLRFVHCGE
jgi:hypothetical protein